MEQFVRSDDFNAAMVAQWVKNFDFLLHSSKNEVIGKCPIDLYGDGTYEVRIIKFPEKMVKALNLTKNLRVKILGAKPMRKDLRKGGGFIATNVEIALPGKAAVVSADQDIDVYWLLPDERYNREPGMFPGWYPQRFLHWSSRGSYDPQDFFISRLEKGEITGPLHKEQKSHISHKEMMEVNDPVSYFWTPFGVCNARTYKTCVEEYYNALSSVEEFTYKTENISDLRYGVDPNEEVSPINVGEAAEQISALFGG